MACATLFLALVQCVSGVTPSPTSAAPAPRVSITALGYAASGALLLVERDGRGVESRSTLQLPNGPRAASTDRTVAFPLGPALPQDERGFLLSDGAWVGTRVAGGLGDRRSLVLELCSVRGAVRLATLPAQDAALGPLSLSPDGRFLLLAVRYGDRSSVTVLDLTRARAKLLLIDALFAVRRGAVEDAERLLEDASALAPDLPEPYYDRACLHASLGDLPRARDELALALAIDRPRLLPAAHSDPDLSPLRADESLWLPLTEETRLR